jgi:His-Xaa-Ser system protein HxsD
LNEQAELTEPTSFELKYNITDRQVSFNVSEDLFVIDAVYGAAYLFVDRCWLFMSRPSDGVIGVHLKTKEDTDEAGLEALAGEFANELLNQAIRVQIADSTATLREYTMARAFFTTPVQSSIDALLAELDAEELEEDELEISVPWEDGSV